MTVVTTVVQSLFPYRILGTVNAVQQSVQTMASAIAAPILGTIMANRFAESLPQLLPAQLQQTLAALPPAQRAALSNPQGLASAGAQAAIQQQFAAFGPDGEQLYRQFIAALHQALTSAIAHLYFVVLVFAALAFLTAFALQEVPLKRDEFFAEEAPTGDVAPAEGRR